jgi:hypothetical protein
MMVLIHLTRAGQKMGLQTLLEKRNEMGNTTSN